MKYILLSLMMLTVTSAFAGELRLDVYGGVRHFDREKVRNGESLHEQPDLKGVSYSEDFEHVRGTVGYMHFTNSIRKATDALYVSVDKSVYAKGEFDTGCGAMAGHFIRGYSIPFYAAPYCYAEYDKVKLSLTGVPTIGNTVDGSIQWKIDVKIWEF